MTCAPFFIIGAQRSGTTWAWRALDAHPDTRMARPIRPEPKVFMDPDAVADCAAYLARVFPDLDQAPLRLGEKSTSYCESDRAADGIARVFPDATIVLILRDPVARAMSNVRFSTENGFETRDMDSAIRADLDDHPAPGAATSVSPFAYAKRGNYAAYLDRYLARFPADQLVVVQAERLIGQAAGLADLYARLGVDPGFVPDSLTDRVNTTHTDPATPPLSADTRARLNAFFAASNARLRDMYGFDLGLWTA